jgi:ankyrin repeat protein
MHLPGTLHWTPLHYAASRGHKEIVELLLEHGADIHYYDHAHRVQTAAEYAMKYNHTEIVQLLISKGADISPLHFAIYMKDEARARSLIEGGADVNKRTPYGTTTIRRAVDAGFKDIVELLIARGVDVNAEIPWAWHWTALHSAAAKGQKEIAELLINAGANVNERSGSDRTPLWYAQEGGHTEIVELLRKHGAKE